MSYLRNSRKNPLVQTFEEETFVASESPWKNITHMFRPQSETILKTSSPFQDKELETLRIQTLVDYKPSARMKWVVLPDESNLWGGKTKDLLRTTTGITQNPKLSRPQKEFIQKVKHALLIRSRLLCQKEIVLNVVREGMRSFNHTLDRLSNITDKKKFNKVAREYLKQISSVQLQQHGGEFRQKLEKCRSLADLDRLFLDYRLQTYSTVKYYPELKIIYSIIKVMAKYEKAPQKLERIMNSYLGKHGEVNVKKTLSQILVTSSIETNIFQAIRKEKTLTGVVKRLEYLGKKSSSKNSHIPRLHKLVSSFAKATSRTSFQEFQAGLNTSSPIIAKKILMVTRGILNKELQAAVSFCLKESRPASERMSHFEKHINNPRYYDSRILLFGFQVSVLNDKIRSVDSKSPAGERRIRHLFNGTDVPDKIVQMIVEAGKESSMSRKKTPENCLLKLEDIANRFRRREPIQLKSELISLFKNFGMVDFSGPRGKNISGYEVAKHITNFYGIPNRTTIDLPTEMNPKIRKLLKDTIDFQRAEQLKKMGR